MKLEELLHVMPGNEYVGLWDIRHTPVSGRKARRHEKCPTRQTYCKVKNLAYEDIRELLRLDVMAINNVDGGFLIRLWDAEAIERSLAHYDLARKIGEDLERRRTTP